MRFGAIVRLTGVLVMAGRCLPAASELVAPDVTVGRNLQAAATVRFSGATPAGIQKLTITSDDPSRLLLSDSPHKAGSASLVVTLLPQLPQSPPFWLQGRADSGATSYTVSAEGVGSAKGAVKLAPSAIVIIGPLREPKYAMTPRAIPAKITVVSVALTGEGKIEAEQQLAGESQVEVEISSSDPKVGKLRASKLLLLGGSSFESTLFEPAAEGETALVPVQPPGFQPGKEHASVVMAVAKPGLAIDGNFYLGKDLQVAGSVILGEAAPPGGLEVTVTSGDPAKLVLSLAEHEPGEASVKVHVPPGQSTAQYFIQALSGSGIVTCEAVASGYRSRVVRVGLVPSGIIVAYDPYGPPDEAAVLRKSELADDRSFSVSLGNPKDRDTKLVVWTAYLDPLTGRAADITVQPLRAGVKATVNLTSSNPAVGTVESPLTIEPGKTSAVSRFTARGKGATIISVDTPAGFATPKNATRVPANVND